jgi:hypothetical protein
MSRRLSLDLQAQARAMAEALPEHEIELTDLRNGVKLVIRPARSEPVDRDGQSPPRPSSGFAKGRPML